MENVAEARHREHICTPKVLISAWLFSHQELRGLVEHFPPDDGESQTQLL